MGILRNEGCRAVSSSSGTVKVCWPFSSICKTKDVGKSTVNNHFEYPRDPKKIWMTFDQILSHIGLRVEHSVLIGLYQKASYKVG
jgi:flagellar motor switch protein FliM